jgi:hypothetical protein
LLQDIIGRLSILNETANPRRYICIVTVFNISYNLPECRCQEQSVGYIKGIPITANAIKLDLIRALAVDLKSFGYGKLKYTKLLPYYSGCRGNHEGIILNSKNTKIHFEHAPHSSWISI